MRVHGIELMPGEVVAGGKAKPMRLVSTRTVGNGLAYLTYELVRDA